MMVQGLGVISLPVYTHFMSEAEYGIASVYLSYANVLAVLITLNLNGAVNRYYFEGKGDHKSFIGTSMMSSAMVMLALSSLIWMFRYPLAEVTNLPVSVFPWLLVFCGATAIWRVYEGLLTAQLKSKRFSVMQVLLQYLKFGMSVLGMLWVVEHFYLGKVAGEAIAAVLVAIYCLWVVLKETEWKFNKEHFQYILNFSLPLVPFVLSANILNYYDQWYINSHLGNADAGLYGFAYKIGLLLTGFSTALLNASNPSYFKMMNEKAYDAVRSQHVSLVKLLVLGSLFLVLFSYDLGMLLSAKESFNHALPVVPVILGGIFCQGMSQFHFRQVYFLKKNYYLLLVIVSAGILNIVLNVWLIGHLGFGYPASAWATLISYGFMWLGAAILSETLLKVHRYPWFQIAKFSLLFAAACGIFALILQAGLPMWQALLLKMVVYGAVALYLYGGRLIRR